MGNVHYMEILDWALGWLGHDIRNDDLATELANEEKAAEVQAFAPEGTPVWPRE